MSEISSSIWNQDKNGDWKLYFNTDSEMQKITIKNKEQQKLKKNNINISDKNLLLGTLVMTSKGIGRLIKSNDDMAHVRFDQDINEYQFPMNEISNTFNCFISFILKGNIDIIRLKLNVAGKVENIFEELEKIKKINLNNNNYSLIYNKTLLSSETTFEQLNLENNSKMLILELSEQECKISRFQIVQKFWYFNNQDGICFSPSQNIKLLGIAIYCPHDNKIMNASIKIIEGASFSGKVLIEENTEIQPSNNKLNTMTKIKFNKSVFCKKNLDYTISLTSNSNSNCYSGSKGKAFIDGERGVKFTFKRIEGNKSRSTVEIGNFPEIYYCLNKI